MDSKIQIKYLGSFVCSILIHITASIIFQKILLFDTYHLQSQTFWVAVTSNGLRLLLKTHTKFITKQ